jgi:O-antigen/teichoic acid export membrane protein
VSFAQRFGRGLVWNQASRVIELGAAYALSVVAARALGPTMFGVYSVAMSAVTLSYFATSLGLNEVLNVHVPRLREQPGRVAFLLRALFAQRVVIAALLALGFAIGAPWVAKVWREPALGPLLRVGAIYVFFYNVSLLLEYFHMGAYEVPRVSRARILVQLLGLAAALAALAQHWPATRLLAALAASAALGVAWLAWGARHALRGPGEPFDLGSLRAFGLTVWATNFLTFFLGRQSDVLLVGFFRPGTAEAGCYAAASLLVNLLASALLMGSEGVSLAAFSELDLRVDRGGLGRLWSLHLKIDQLLSVPLLIFGARFAPDIVGSIYSKSFTPAALLLQSYVAAWVLARITGGGTNMTLLYAINRPRLPLVLYGVCGLANLGLNLVLVPRYGAAGAVLGTGLAIVGSSVASCLLVARHTGTAPPFGFSLRLLVACGAALLAVHWLPVPPGFPGLLLAGIVGLVVFLGALHLLHPFDDDDRRLLTRLSPRIGALAARL